MKIMVAYDGTLQAKEALEYGMRKARETGGEMVALHVFNSPLFVDYDATPDAESIARAEYGRFIDEAKAIIREKGAGVKASLYSAEGNPEKEVIGFAREENVDVLLCPPKFKGIIGKYRRALGASDLARETKQMNVTAVALSSR